MKRTFALSAIILLATSLSACGLTGPLQRPGPLVGNPEAGAEADLPEGQAGDLPQLPERPQNRPAQSGDDELMGGPGGF